MLFQMPATLYTERGAVKNHKSLFSQYGSKALLVTGKHSALCCGAQADVTSVLQENGTDYVIYNEIEENPSIESIEKAASFGKNNQADFVIGIGGGSSLDASKAIALLINNPQADGSIFYNPDPSLAALPVLAVPTTCGTGSEVTPYAILTDHKKQTKKSISYRIFPKAAFADPKYLESASPSLIRNTAVDALAHLIESYINTRASHYSKMLCEYGLKLWSCEKEALINGQFSPMDYENLTAASTIAGMAITHTGTSLPHGMSYHITYHQGIPHGCAAGIFLGSYVEYSHDQKTVNTVLDLLGYQHIRQLKDFLRKLLPPVHLSRQETALCISGLLGNKDKLSNCPYIVTRELLEKMYEDSLIIDE